MSAGHLLWSVGSLMSLVKDVFVFEVTGDAYKSPWIGPNRPTRGGGVRGPFESNEGNQLFMAQCMKK